MSNKQSKTEIAAGDENKATPKKRASRKPSQTAQILANVEMLLEMHENPGKSEGNFDALLGQIESLQQESARLNERTNRLVEKLETAATNDSPAPSSQTNDEILEWLESANEETISTIEKKFEQKFAELSEKLENVSQPKQSSEEQSKLLEKQTKKIESQLEKRFEKLESRLSKIADQLDAENSSSPDFDPSSLDGIFAKQSEQLDGSLELLADHVKEQTDSAVTAIETKLADTIANTFTDFDSQFKELAESVKSQEHSSDSGFSDSTLELITAAFDTKTSEVVAGLNESFGDRLDEFDKRITKVTSAIEGQQSLIESVREQSADTEEISNKTDVIVGTFKNQVDELFEGVGSRIARFSEFLARQEIDETAVVQSSEEPAKEESTSHWERQKAAMLSKYGIDPDHRPCTELPGTKKQESQETPIELDEQASENLEGLHDSIRSISVEDAEAIEKLKEDLTSKLREAEIELSINRAKLSQQKAELEEKQVEIERREESLRKKSAYQQASDTQKASNSMLDRMKKHLGMGNTEEN